MGKVSAVDLARHNRLHAPPTGEAAPITECRARICLRARGAGKRKPRGTPASWKEPNSWTRPKPLAPDAWCYFTESGIEVYFNGSLVCEVPRLLAKRYAKEAP